MRSGLGQKRTGTVFVENFDEGVALSLQGQLVDVQLDGVTSQEYAVGIPGVVGPSYTGGMVPIIFENPDEAVGESKLPNINVMRTAIDPAFQRWHSGKYAYRVPAPSSKVVKGSHGRRGPDLVEKKPYAFPFDLSYDVHCRAKLTTDGHKIFRHVGKHLWALGFVTVIDSEGAPRTYDIIQGSIGNLADLAEVGKRTLGHTVPIRVIGELDFNDPYVKRTATDIFVSATSAG